MLKSLFKRPYHVLNQIVISQSALKENLQTFREQNPGVEVSVVLKSNAYGHGLKEVGRILDGEKCPYFVVDSLYEAYALRKAGVRTPLLVLGYQNPNNLRKGMPFTFTAYDLASLKTLIDKKLPFHLEVDTGMHRMGLSPEELPRALTLLKQAPHLCTGFFSHLMTADSPDENRLRAQERVFVEALTLLRAEGLSPLWIHLGNSAGTPKLHIPELNMARLGIGLYGGIEGFRPALHVESTLVAVRDLNAGEALSYGATFIADKEMTVGVIPFGYYEGLPIALSNVGSVRYKDHDCPIVGRVNMNHTFLDVTGLEARVGDPASFYTSEGASSVMTLAEQAKTISYELLVRLSSSIRRIVRP